MLPIHFHGLNPQQRVLPIAYACGISKNILPFPMPRRFDRLSEMAPQHWRAAELHEARLLIYVHAYHDGPETAEAARVAQEAGIPALFFRGNDVSTPAHPPYGVVYRTSIFADQQTSAERAMPDFCDDPLRDHQGEVPVRARTATPSIGFCGFVGTPLRRLIYRLTGRSEKVAGLALRERAMRAFEASQADLDCRFIRRTMFWNGALSKAAADSQKNESRQAFVDNLFGTDYNLCMRGQGNYSTRYYEVLAAGRIPVFINTRCVLPFADQIDYRKHCVWVEEDELHRAGEIVADFHASHDDDEFHQLQLDNRRLWEQWLSPEAFHERILREIVSEHAAASPPRAQSPSP